MPHRWDTVELLRHYRHDWLNQLQLISGYLGLGDKEKAEKVIEETIAAAYNESQLSNLQMPDFAEEVLTFNWKNHQYVLTFDVVCERNWSGYEQKMTRFFYEMTDFFDRFAQTGEEQHLTLTVSDSLSRMLTFHFNGSLLNDDQLSNEKKTDSNSI